jgi:heat-inducible transcriptional repressor
VEQRLVDLPEPVADETIGDLRTSLNQRLRDRPLAEAPAIIADLPETTPQRLRGLLTALTAVLLETLVERHGDRVLLGGTANLTEHAVDFPAIRPVLEALEEQVVLLRLMDQTVAAGEVLIRIGNETGHEGLQSTSLVSSAYGSAGALLGGVGVFGPRRMDYPHTIARVAAVARYVGDLLDAG